MRGDAGGDVGIEILTRTLWHERRNVADQSRVDDRVIGRGDKRGPKYPVSTVNGAHSCDQVRLQLEQFRGWLRDNACEANVVSSGCSSI